MPAARVVTETRAALVARAAFRPAELPLKEDWGVEGTGAEEDRERMGEGETSASGSREARSRAVRARPGSREILSGLRLAGG